MIDLLNPNEKSNEVIINYHFLYAYDPKTEKEGKTIKIASHVFDRESVNIIFKWNKDNPSEEPVPDSIVYGAHLSGQTLSLKREDGGTEQEWSTGRVKLKWENVYVVNNKNHDRVHPIVAIARGSHAPYPVPGKYAVTPIEVHTSVEPADAEKALIPFDYQDSKSKISELFKSKEVDCYKLVDLELGSITSSSWNSILAFSGYTVDIIGPTDTKFPPFTKRETEIDKWVNGTEDDPVHNWDPEKVDKTTHEKLKDLVNNIEQILNE